MVKAKERVRIAMSPETVRMMLSAKAKQVERNLSNKQMFSKIVTAFVEADEWDLDTLETTATVRRKEASAAYRLDPRGQHWRELADQSNACAQIFEIASGDVDALRRLSKTLKVEVPELHAYDNPNAPSVAVPEVRHFITDPDQ